MAPSDTNRPDVARPVTPASAGRVEDRHGSTGGAPAGCAEPWDFAELRFVARCYRRPMVEDV